MRKDTRLPTGSIVHAVVLISRLCLAGDDFSGAGAITPTRMDNPRDQAAKRKQTLLSLLDALNELSKEEGLGGLGASCSPGEMVQEFISFIYRQTKF